MTRPVTTTSAPARRHSRDAPAAEVGVRRDGLAELPKPSSPRGQQVVPGDVADPRRQAEPARQVTDRGRQAGRVESAGVGDDRDALVECKAQAVLELAKEGPRVAEARVPQAVPAKDQHGQLGQIVAGQHVKLAALEHLPHAGEPVAIKARRVPDPDRRLLSRSGFLDSGPAGKPRSGLSQRLAADEARPQETKHR